MASNGLSLDSLPLHLSNSLYFLPILFTLLLISYILYQRLLSPLSSIPGPFTASLSRLWMIRHSSAGDMPHVMIALHRQHGALVRTGPNEVSVSDLSAIKSIYGAGTKFRKSDWYSVWQGRRKFDLFAERDEGVHGRQRRLVSRAYAMESLRDLERFVDESVRVFLGKMDEKARSGKVVDLGNWVQLFAFGQLGSFLVDERLAAMGADARGQT